MQHQINHAGYYLKPIEKPYVILRGVLTFKTYLLWKVLEDSPSFNLRVNHNDQVLIFAVRNVVIDDGIGVRIKPGSITSCIEYVFLSPVTLSIQEHTAVVSFW